MHIIVEALRGVPPIAPPLLGPLANSAMRTEASCPFFCRGGVVKRGVVLSSGRSAALLLGARAL